MGICTIVFLVSSPELVLHSCVTVFDPCPSDQAATPCVEVAPWLSAAAWHRPVSTWAVGILDIVFLHGSASQHRGAISAAVGNKHCLSHTEKSLLSSIPPTTHLNQHLDHNICQGTDGRILQSHSLSTVMHHQKLLAITKGSRAGSIHQDHNSVFQCLTKGGINTHMLLLRSPNKTHGQSLHTSQKSYLNCKGKD